MQDQTTEDEIRKRPAQKKNISRSAPQKPPMSPSPFHNKREERENSPLRTHSPKLGFIPRITLDAQTGREHELAYRGTEPS